MSGGRTLHGYTTNRGMVQIFKDDTGRMSRSTKKVNIIDGAHIADQTALLVSLVELVAGKGIGII